MAHPPRRRDLGVNNLGGQDRACPSGPGGSGGGTDVTARGARWDARLLTGGMKITRWSGEDGDQGQRAPAGPVSCSTASDLMAAIAEPPSPGSSM